MRVALFTDTLNDVNGVSRFIRNIGHQAFTSSPRCELMLVTSTRLPAPGFSVSEAEKPGRRGDAEYIRNFRPIYAGAMPGYPQLEIVLPPKRAMAREVRAWRPDAIHVSTPGPVGMVGRAIAKRLDVPLVGTYHTDFPAYMEHLFGDPTVTLGTTAAMRRFYRPFGALFTRSAEYGEALVEMGYPRERIVRLRPGIETGSFDAGLRDETGDVWSAQRVENATGDAGLSRNGLRRGSVKVLYVGRVSVEKNLPLLVKVWPRVSREVKARGGDVQLVVIGDGPYRERMQRELAEHDAHFLGFRHGRELSRLYASADVFVFPSTTDTLGQVVMEAQCAGLPVIVTDQGGPSEVVDEERTGFVLPVRGAAWEDMWVRRMVELSTDHTKRKAMGAAATEKIRPMSIRHSFEHFWEVHAEVVRGHAARASE